MKQLKKMMLVMTLALCALGLTACRTNSNDNTTNITENGNATGNTSATETNGATDNTTGTTGETLTNETGEDTVGTGAGTGSDGQNDAGTAPNKENSAGDDIREGVDDIGDGIREGVDDIADDLDGNRDTDKAR